MKTLIALSLIVIFAGCKKQNVEPQTTELQLDCGVETLIDNHSNARVVPDSSFGVFLLDFNGQTVTHPDWNGGKTFICEPSGVSDSAVINEVIKDFAPYRVIVTTDETVYYKASVSKRMRAIVTASSSWNSQNVSGTAHINSLFWGKDSPCFIFSNKLSYNNHMVAEIVSHELGHTVGLNHQAKWDNCKLVETYSTGDGINAPIMGNPLRATNGGSWSDGLTPNSCRKMQYDAAFLANKLFLK